MDVIDTVLNNLPRSFPDLSHRLVYRVELWPYFIGIHFILVTLSMKARDGSVEYARSHPFPSWFVCVTSCFGGTLLVNFIFAKPIVEIYANSKAVLLATVIWYLIFFAPFNVVEKFFNTKGARCILLVLKEVHRIHSIYNGVKFASSICAGNVFIIVLVGSIRGSASKFILRPLDAFVRGNLANENEFLKPTFSTKYSVIASLLLFLQQQQLYIHIKKEDLICLLFIMAAVTQVLLLLTEMNDPIKPLEDMIGYIFLKAPEDLVEEVKKNKKD